MNELQQTQVQTPYDDEIDLREFFRVLWAGKWLIGGITFAAAAGSLWAIGLRERKGIDAYAIDLTEIDESYRCPPYYRLENVTQTTFADAAVTGTLMHCACEILIGDEDGLFIQEVARILRPGSKLVIQPLYMHTLLCLRIAEILWQGVFRFSRRRIYPLELQWYPVVSDVRCCQAEAACT